MKTNRRPKPIFPPELGAEVSAGELRGLEQIWMLFDIGASFEEQIPTLGSQMRMFLRSRGLIHDNTTQKPGRVFPLFRARILQLQPWKGYSAIAAIIIVLLAVGITLDTQTLDSPYGEHSVNQLADGSTVTLNSGTRLRVASDFGNKSRNINLVRGEALFDVEPGSIPFRVTTRHATVEALGTKFNVRYWPTDSESATAVAVESGRVMVTDLSGREPYILGPSEVVEIDAENRAGATQSARDADNQLSWVRRSFKFSDHLTGDILEELERRYDVNIKVEVEGLEHTRSGILLENPQGPQDVLADLCDLRQCVFSKGPEDNTYTLSPR